MESYRAIANRMFDRVKDFINSSTNLSKFDFMRAAQAGQLQTLQITWDNLSDTAKKDYLDNFNTYEYSLILQNHHFDVAQWLFERFSIEQRNYSFFGQRQTEVQHSTFITFRKLMEAGKFKAARWYYNHSPDAHKTAQLVSGGYNALYFAAQFNDEAMIEWVLQECDMAKRAELLSANGNTAFKYCSKSGNLEIVKSLTRLTANLLGEQAIRYSLRDIFYHAIGEKIPEPNTLAIWNWYAEEVFKSDITPIQEVIKNSDFQIFRRSLQLKSLDCAKWLYKTAADVDYKKLDAIAQQEGFNIEGQEPVTSIQPESAMSL